MRRLLFGLLILAAPGVASAWPVCVIESRRKTLIAEFREADAVVVGRFIKTRTDKDGRIESDFEITETLKHHPLLKGKDVLTLPRSQTSESRFVIYLEAFKGQLDPYRGIEAHGNGELIDYLKGAIPLKDASPMERLSYAFRHLHSVDPEAAADAYQEFTQASYDDYKSLAAVLPPDTLLTWMRNPKLPPERRALYGRMLGHAGAQRPEKYGKALREMLDNPRREGSGIEGLLAGYSLLQPKDALQYLNERFSDPKEDFLLRYACLRTYRFLWEQQPGLVPKKELVRSMILVARLPDMCDFGVEDLRRWKRWEATPDILPLFGKNGFDTPLIKRTILRYALQSAAQGNKEAAAFVARQERDFVRAVQEEEPD